MFFEDLRSERQLMRIVCDRLSLRWYLGYDLHEPLPDHSSLTRIRERYGLSVFRRFFEKIVDECLKAGLVWGKELFFDATKVEANASLDSAGSRALAEHRLGEHLAGVFLEEEPRSLDGIPSGLAVVGPEGQERQTLTQTNAGRHRWIAGNGRQERVVRWGYRRMADLRMSITDPDALVTPVEVNESLTMLEMLFKSRFRWRLRLRSVTGDAAYGTRENLASVEKSGIRAYLALPDQGKRTSLFTKDTFAFDAQRDVYTCPRGETLHRLGRDRRGGYVKYGAKPSSCNECPLKSKCTNSTSGRWVSRSVGEECLERVRAYRHTEAYRKSLRKLAVWVEPLFAEAKEWHRFRRFRLRRLEKVNTEALMIASGQNVKRLLTFGAKGPRRPAQVADLRRPAAGRSEFCEVIRVHRRRCP
ncbi:MAG TPA: transposase [Rubrobacter sp.]|nr:transposase [Rubrobacter sp.]